MAKIKKEHDEAIRATGRRCRGTLSKEVREKVNKLLGEGNLAEARQTDRAGRSGCGADFNDIIAAGSLDGKTHEYECPKCGLKGEYTAPKFD